MPLAPAGPPRRLPWWTWIAPFILGQIGTQLSLRFNLAPGTALGYLTFALSLVMLNWWGPRVLVGVYLNALVSAGLWGLPHWFLWPLYALPETLEIFLAWLLFVRLFRGQVWLPNAYQLVQFTALGVMLPVLAGNIGMQGLRVWLGLLAPAAFGNLLLSGGLAHLLSGLAVTMPLLIWLTPGLEQRGLTLTRGATAIVFWPRRLFYLNLGESTAILGALLLLSQLPVPVDKLWIVYGLIAFWASLRFGIGLALVANSWTLVCILLLPHFIYPPPGAFPAPDSLLSLGLIGICSGGLLSGRIMSDLHAEIDRRHATEQMLRRYALFAEQARDIILVIAPDGRIVEANQAAAQAYGYTRAELLALRTENLLAPTAPAESAPGLAQAGTEGQLFETCHRRKDGRVFPVEISSRSVPWDGQRVWVSIVRDITERQQAEAARQISEQNYRLISELISDYIFHIRVADNGSVQIDWVTESFYAITGRTLAEAQNVESWATIFHPEDVEKAMALLRRLLTARQSQSGALQCRAFIATGQLRWVNIFARSEWDEPAQRVTTIVGAVQDITERKQAEEELRLQHELSLIFNATHHLPEALERMLNLVLQVETIDSGGVYLADPATGALDLVAHHGLSPEFIAVTTHYPPEAPQARLVHAGQAIYGSYADIQKDRDEVRRREGLRALAVVPIQHDGELLAVFNLASHTQTDIPPNARHLLETLANHMGNLLGRLRAEQALRASEETYRFLTENVADIIWACDFNYRFSFVSAAVEKFLGYTAEEFKALPTTQIILPESLEQALRQLQAQLAEIAAGQASAYRRRQFTFDIQHRHKDGSMRWGEVTYAFRFDSTDQPLDLYGLTRDITERRQVETALRESEGRYRRLTAAVTDYMYTVRVEGDHAVETIHGPGCVEVTGYEPADFAANPFLWYQMVAPEDRPAVELQIRLMLEEHEARPLEHRLLRKDGAQHWVRNTLVPHFDAAGQLTSYDGLLQDITEHKQAEETQRLLNVMLEGRVRERTAQLEAALKELEAFTYSISHDLRTPLRGIDGFSQVLLEDYAGSLDADGQRHLRRIRAATQLMGELIDDLLKLARLSRGELKRARFDLSTLAQDLAAELRQREPDRAVDFRIQANCYVNADERLLRVALENLLHNAWKFTRPKLHAQIEFGRQRQTDGRLVYFVRDNGAGFNMEYASKLFGAFQRLHGAREFPGTGMGLAIVQRILQRHGGQIWAESTPDQGSTFYFTLPG